MQTGSVRVKLAGLITGLDKYFVRPCYRDYFQVLVDMLKDDYCNLTCTGTPGVGKTAFMQFFIEEYLKIEPETHFMLSVFSTKGKHVISQWIHIGEHGLVMELFRSIPLDNQVGLPQGTLIHLYNGWSELGASRTNRCIAFPTPNSRWFREIENSSHDIIYLPPWTFEELEYANYCLQLGIDDKTLTERYYMFGGTAKFTLTTDKEFYDFGVESLKVAYSSYFKTYKQLLDAFETARKIISKSEDMDSLCDQLFHYIPTENYFRKCQIILGSSEITERFDTLIHNLNDRERYELVQSLNVRFAESIIEHLFELVVYERLVRGNQINMRSLLEKDVMDTNIDEKNTLTIPPDSYFRIKGKRLPSSELFNELLFPDDSNMMESIDGVFVDESEKILYLFIITIRKTHQVGYNDLVKLAEIMQKTEAIARGEVEIRLVFIVPEENEASFSKQNIKGLGIPETFDSTARLEFGAIEGLRQASVHKLINVGAKTLGDLKEMFEAGQVQYKAVEQFFKHRNPDLIKNIRKVNQFVTGLKFAYNKET